ncbi:hypothetical protein AB4144_52295, partial [Rhizobiaceae sp. 2RAB30]
NKITPGKNSRLPPIIASWAPAAIDYERLLPPDEPIRVNRIHDAGPSAEPASDGAKNKRHKGRKRCSRGSVRGSISSIGSLLLQQGNTIAIILFQLCHLLRCLIERDAARCCKCLRRLFAGRIGILLAASDK